MKKRLFYFIFMAVFICAALADNADECRDIMPDSVSGYPLDSSSKGSREYPTDCSFSGLIMPMCWSVDLVYSYTKTEPPVTHECGMYVPASSMSGSGIGDVFQIYIVYTEVRQGGCFSCVTFLYNNEIMNYVTSSTYVDVFEVDGLKIQEKTSYSGNAAAYFFRLAYYEVGIIYETSASDKRTKAKEVIRAIINKIKAKHPEVTQPLCTCGNGICDDSGDDEREHTFCPADCDGSASEPSTSEPSTDYTDPDDSDDYEPDEYEPDDSSPTVLTGCGDGRCADDENCKYCSTDCACKSGECCSPYYNNNADSKGCVQSGKATINGIMFVPYICCSGEDIEGECCDDSQCGSGQKCYEHDCRTPAEINEMTRLLETGESCADGTRCRTGYCHKVSEYVGYCCEKGNVCCRYNDECPAGEFCSEDRNICMAFGTGHEGDYCREATECDGYCWGDPHYVNYCCKSGEICCTSDYDCPDDMKCDTNNPVRIINEDIIFSHCIQKTIEELKSASGQACEINSDCYMAGNWCNNWYCCPEGKTCCVDDNSCPGGYGEYECNEQNYCVKTRKEVPQKGSRCCNVLNDEQTFDGPMDADNCIAHGVSGRVYREDDNYIIICCNGQKPISLHCDQCRPKECCDTSDCPEGKVCSAYNYCLSAIKNDSIYVRLLTNPAYLFGMDIAGISKDDLERYDKDRIKKWIFGVSGAARDASSWYQVARFEFLKGQERLMNSKNLGYFDTLYTTLDKVYFAASLADAASSIKTDFKTLSGLKSAGEIIEHADVLISFADNLGTIFSAVESDDTSVQKEDSKIMMAVDGVLWSVGVAASGGWSLLSDISHGITSNTKSSINFEIQMAAINLAAAAHAQRMAELSSTEIVNENNYETSEARESISSEELHEFLYHAEQLIILKKIELLVRYRDDVAIYLDQQDLAVRTFSWFGVVDPDAIVKERKADLDLMLDLWDTALNNLNIVKKTIGVE